MNPDDDDLAASVEGAVGSDAAVGAEHLTAGGTEADTGEATADTTDADVDDDTLVQRNSVRRNMAQMASSQIVTWVLATLTAVIVPRWLGPSTLGRLQLAGSLWAIAAVFTALGTSMFLQLAIARNQREGLSMLAPVFVVRTCAFLFAAAVLAVYVGIAENDRQFVIIMVITGITVILVQWSDVYSAAFTGLERMSILAVLGAAGRFAVLVATVAVLALGYGVYGVVTVPMVTSFLGLLILAWRFGTLGRMNTSRWRSHAWHVVTASAPFMAVTLALMTYRQIDVIVISRVAGSRDVGWYAAADVLAGSLLFPTTVIMSTIFPTFGRLHANDPAELRHLVRRTFSLLFLVAVPIGLGAAVVGPTFAPLLYGDEFDGTGEALVIFGLITILSFGTTLLAYLALATERNRFLAWLLVVSAVLTIGLDVVLVPWASDRFDNGAIGGALAFVVTEVLQFTLGLAVIAPYIVTRAWAWRSLRVLAAGGLMVAATLPFRDELFLIPAAIGAVVYPLAVVLFRAIDDDQKAMVGEVLARLGLRTRWAR